MGGESMREARKKRATVRDLPSARRVDRVSHHRTRLLEEALDTVLSPGLRDGVLIAAGWDRDADAPEGAPAIAEWVTGSLLPCAARVTSQDAMAQLREQLGLLLGASGDLPAEGSHDVKRSGVQASNQRASRGRPPMMTHAPEIGEAKTVLLWSRDTVIVDGLRASLGSAADLVAIEAPAELRFTLELLADRAPLVVLDRREGDDEELLALDAADFADLEVVVWGPRTLETPSLQRILCDASRAVGCTGEAEAGDVIDLCVTVLGIERAR